MTTLPTGDRRVDYSGWHRHDLNIRGSRITLHRKGEGAPLVYLHGGGTWHGLGFATNLTDYFDVIVPHHPGFGLSDDNPSVTSIDDCVEHYRSVFDSLGLDAVFLMGSSLGGRIAAEFASRYPSRVAKLILAAPAGLDVAEHPLLDLSTIEPQDFPSYLVRDLNVLVPFLPTGPDEEFVMMRAREGAAAMRLLQVGGLENPHMPQLLQQVNAPTLILWGLQDQILPAGRAEHWLAALPNAELKTFQNVGHLPLDETPDARQAVLHFLT